MPKELRVWQVKRLRPPYQAISDAMKQATVVALIFNPEYKERSTYALNTLSIELPINLPTTRLASVLK